MKNCKYIINATGEQFDSYSDLLDNYADSSLWNTLEDLVFSVASNQDAIYTELINLNKEYRINREVRSEISGITDGEANISDNNSFNLNEFLDSDVAAINGKRIVTKLNTKEYLDNLRYKFTHDLGMSEEEANRAIDNLVRSNEIIVEDSILLHSFLTSSLLVSSEDDARLNFIRKFLNEQTSRFEGNSLLIDQLYNGLRDAYFKAKEPHSSSRLIKDLNLKGKLNGISKDLIGHIDYLFIDLNGTLHLYNFKVSSQHYSQWPSAKWEKYKALLVLLKYLLANNGINVKNIDLNIIPIHLQYNDDFSKISSVRVLSPYKISSRTSDGSYALDYYDNLISRFLTDNYVPKGISNNAIEEATKDVRKIFPNLNITEEGIQKTAEEWIKNAPDCDPYDTEPLVISEVHLPNHGYDLIIRLKDGTTKTIQIKSDREKLNNRELLLAVREHVQYLKDNRGYLINLIKEAVKESYKKGDLSIFSDTKGLPSTFLTSIFYKYLSYTVNDNKERTYQWELLDNLSDANILAFRHKDTNQIDLVSLSSFNLNSSPNFKGSSVLGCYCYDVETNVFKGDFGNIELIRTMALLNRVADSFGPDTKLGKIQVINTLTQTQRSYSASYLNRQLFSQVLNRINIEYSDSPIKNNLYSKKFADEVEILLDEYTSLTDSMPDSEKDFYASLGFDVLLEVSESSREYALFNIMSEIYDKKTEWIEDESLVLNAAKSSVNKKDKYLARLLILASNAYQAVRGEQTLHESNLPSIDSITFTAMTVPDSNIKIVTENLLITHDTISSEFIDLFSPINKVFEEFFKDAGYTDLRNMTIGDEARTFLNLYDEDSELMSFKNPYDFGNDLRPHERILLKKILFAMAKISYGDNFSFSSYDDPKLKDYIESHKQYLWVPLEKASDATARQTFQGIKSVMKHIKNLLTNSKDRFENAMENLLSEEADLLDKGFKSMLLTNTFSLSMPIGRDFSSVEKSRRKMLKRGKSFYETNLKDIFIDYLFRSISTELYNKLLIGTKALLLSLHLTNDYGGNEEVVNKEIEYIKDYLKVNVFSRSIMEPKNLKIMSFILPIKSKITNMLLMGNIVSYFRDCFQGVLENMTRSAIKFNTNISPKSMAAAYAYVTTHSTSNARAVNLLSKLCLRYRISNTDVGRISLRAKSSRNGIFNWDKIAYGTLRGPDFLNRMTLFVAKCMEDGCWDGWYIDDNDDLKYNWKNDKRFSLLAAEDTSDMEKYALLRSLYFSMIREYNKEHPDQKDLDISLNTDLPWPYSNKEILSIKAVGDNIYGSYDKSKKGMIENWALGVCFGMFTTWFNGIYNNYFGKAGSYATSKLKLVQDVDPVTGLLLYFDVKAGLITTNAISEDGTPNDIMWKHVPIIVLGIFPTIGSLYKVLKNDGKQGLIDYLKANEGERANIRKLISDLLITGLFLLLFKGLFDKDYKDYKKEMKNNSLALNLVIEILYKSSSRSYDSFMGPVNIILQFGSNMNPPYYSAPIKLLQDTYNVIFGEKQFGTLMTDNLGIARAAKDSYRAELRKD